MAGLDIKGLDHFGSKKAVAFIKKKAHSSGCENLCVCHANHDLILLCVGYEWG